MTEIRTEKRRFTRIALDLPVDVHQGGSVWKQRLIGFSVQHVDRENIEPLRQLLEQHMDIATLEEELGHLV